MPHTHTFDVAIIGLGPTGATLANLLGARGISVLAVERDTDVYPNPRAIVLDHEGMRIFQSAGLAERVLPHVANYNSSHYYGASGRIIKHLVLAPPPHLLGWFPNYSFTQPAVDQALRDGAAERSTVDLRLGTELVDMAANADGVSLTIRGPGGKNEQHRARYLVACDGGSSPIRRRVGIGLDDLDFDERWLVVDALIDPAHLANLPAVNVQYCEPKRPSTYVIGPGVHRRWEIMLLPGETMEEMNREERIWQVLARWIEPGNAKLWRSAAYRFHALVAKEWHNGRTIIAGDAAHMTPPFIGQGMCQGLRDAANLAWKLELILRAGAPAERLLHSYTQERAPHVRATTEVAKALGRIICELDHEKAAARDAELLAHGDARPEVRQGLIPGLADGILSSRDTPARGQHFPQPRVRHDGSVKLLDDVTGARFRLVVRTGDLSALARDPRVKRLDIALLSMDRAPQQGVIAIDECDRLLADWLDRNGIDVALARPDHYVFGTGKSLDDAVALIADAHEQIFG